MARTVECHQVTGVVMNRMAGAPLAHVTVTASSTVYTDREMTLPTKTVTTDGVGRFTCFTRPGNYSFTCSDPAAAPIEDVEVFSFDMGVNCYIDSDGIDRIVRMSQADYSALPTPDPNVLYVVT